MTGIETMSHWLIDFVKKARLNKKADFVQDFVEYFKTLEPLEEFNKLQHGCNAWELGDWLEDFETVKKLKLSEDEGIAVITEAAEILSEEGYNITTVPEVKESTPGIETPSAPESTQDILTMSPQEREKRLNILLDQYTSADPEKKEWLKRQIRELKALLHQNLHKK